MLRYQLQHIKELIEKFGNGLSRGIGPAIITHHKEKKSKEKQNHDNTNKEKFISTHRQQN